MKNSHSTLASPLRIFYLEDNPLIVFHVEQMVEDMGHVFTGSLDSFGELQEKFSEIEMDGALIDIDLTDGRTGPLAAAWLCERGIPSIFLTGQKEVAEEHSDLSLGIITKPISESELAEKLQRFHSKRPR
jgi:DNA-binding response OmpR family regulator